MPSPPIFNTTSKLNFYKSINDYLEMTSTLTYKMLTQPNLSYDQRKHALDTITKCQQLLRSLNRLNKQKSVPDIQEKIKSDIIRLRQVLGDAKAYEAVSQISLTLVTTAQIIEDTNSIF